MANRPEIPIRLDESILVINYKKPQAVLTSVKRVEDDYPWQKASLLSLRSPASDYHMTTRIRREFGVYSNRSDQYRFLRTDIVPRDTVLKYLECVGNGNTEKLIMEALGDICRGLPVEVVKTELYRMQLASMGLNNKFSA